MNGFSRTNYAWLSIGAAVLTIGLKLVAYLFTGSVGLLSDAIESLVNLVGGVMALAMLTIAARPADEDHAYGHTKAEYFSSGVEGTLILVAALSIGYAALPRLFTPQPLDKVGIGLGVSVIASLVNLVTALILLRAGKEFNSITLQANAQHLLTDVLTSVGVLIGVGAVVLTRLEWLDPVVAIIVALNIIRSGIHIVRNSVLGLMDTGIPLEEQKIVQEILRQFSADEVQFHALRTRQAGVRKFVSMHVLVPGDWTVKRGHELLERIETTLRHDLPNTTVFTHLEPLDDPTSWADTKLDRTDEENLKLKV